MIRSYAMDVEIFPNLFSITFVDLKDYLTAFKDCVNEKGKPIPLTECMSVADIKVSLDIIKSKIFWISDTDDSQLLELVSFINGMQAHYETTISEDGTVSQVPVRTDLFGFNSQGYDDLMVRAFMMHFNRMDSTKHLITYLYGISKKIVDLQKQDKDAFFQDKDISLIRQYRLPYATCDVQQVFGLHAASVVIDKDGNRNKFGKSLKQTSINLKWHELLDFRLPPIDDEEANLYWRKKDNYRGLSLDNLNSLITNDFDRYILPKYIEPMLYYNKNDVFLVCEMVRQNPDEVKLRYGLEHAFGIKCLSSARSNISDKLLVKFYSKFSGLHKSQFEKGKTERTRISFNKVIFPHIQFKTPELQAMLEEIKKVYIYHTTDKDFSKEITFDGTTYKLACGGIHSVDPPRVLKSDDKYVYLHHDYTSYYPSIMISYKVAPKHLNANAFAKMVDYFKSTRVAAKHNVQEHVIDGVDNHLTAEALKIVINAIYGKLGSDVFWLYDRFAQMQVTINGQLMTMTLIEALSLAGIKTVSANTDGIVIKLPRDKMDEYKRITAEWNETNQMSADFETYKIIVSRDVNSYFDIQTDDTTEFKGALDPLQYRKNYSKGYDMPIVAKAVYEYFVNNTPVMETLQNHTDILDFCKTQNVGKQFDVVYDYVENGEIKTHHSQPHVRFYVSTSGVVIQKEHRTTKQRSRLASGLPVRLLNSLDDKDISERNINYKYYYDEAYKIINPIKLGIASNQKGNSMNKTTSGKVLLRKYDHDYLTLFDNED